MTPASILLVDDDPDDVDLVRLALRRLGRNVQVHVCADGPAALDKLRHLGQSTDGPAVVLLDVKLRGLSGIEVLRHLRTSSATARLPVVLMTSSVEERDVADGYAAGASAYLRKPDTFNGLVDVVGAIVRFWVDLNVLPTVTTRGGVS